jgi:predicted Zn-dependent protease
MTFRKLCLLLALGFTAGCETTNIKPATEGNLRLAEDERRLWFRVEQEQAAIDTSGFIAPWPEVDKYLNDVLRGLHAPSLSEGAPFRVHVIVDSSLNAFALPNGALYIHTGMLARLENEAQLAAVLGHEITHATHRHGLKSYRNIKNQSAILAAFTVSTGGIGGLLGGVGMMASVSGYSQDLEREADRAGFRMMIASGYDPRESAKVFRILLAEAKRSKIKEPFFFGSHPKLSERITSYDQLVAALPGDQRQGRTDAEAYAAILPRVLIGNAEAALRARDFDFAQASAERCLALRPNDPEAVFQLAEVFRRRDHDGDAANALSHYRELALRSPDFAGAHRGMGLTAFKLGDKAAALSAFQRYLSLAPAADDRAHVESYIQQCQTLD